LIICEGLGGCSHSIVLAAAKPATFVPSQRFTYNKYFAYKPNSPDLLGSPQYAASEIAADEIAGKNWPPMQRADILNRRLLFRRHQFTPTHK